MVVENCGLMLNVKPAKMFRLSQSPDVASRTSGCDQAPFIECCCWAAGSSVTQVVFCVLDSQMTIASSMGGVIISALQLLHHLFNT